MGLIGDLPFHGLRMLCMYFVCLKAYTIRLGAVNVYGEVIHEFDPWFNFRATQYLVDHGWNEFKDWFDEESWYPLGRPVGHTIYPGMMITSQWVYHGLDYFGHYMSLNTVCVYMPAWFAVVTCIFTYGLGYEVHGHNVGLASAAFMAVLPAHLMRSIAGGYDNECVAVALIVGCMYVWVRALRGKSQIGAFIWGFIVAFMYVYLVSTWGGYVFVLNMIGVHALVLVLVGRFNRRLHIVYSIFYVFGTYGALQFPVVGQAPLRSMEQLGPMVVFFGMHLWAACETQRHTFDSAKRFNQWRFKTFLGSGVGAIIFMGLFLPAGYLGPLSARVRGLFLRHDKTGNPLVDSVAEHQATQFSMYWRYFHWLCYLGPLGIIPMAFKRNVAAIFIIQYCLVAAYFSRKMIRLILLLAPGAAVAAGVITGVYITWAYNQFAGDDEPEEQTEEKPEEAKPKKQSGKKNKKKQAKSLASGKGGPVESLTRVYNQLKKIYDAQKLLRKIVAVALLLWFLYNGRVYMDHSNHMAQALSEPQVVSRAKGRNGETFVLNDIIETYHWLRDNTPENSRVMAWWDYGYQINGIANRTSIADGNTWNHEHIALLGKCLCSPEKKGHKIIRHLADYVMVWSTSHAGMYGDDLAKMGHVCKIAGSVYPDIEQTGYWRDRQGNPSKLMRRSILYKMHSQGIERNQGDLSLRLYEEAYTSKHRMVRVYKVLKKAKRKKFNRQYPKALTEVLATKTDFKQIHGL